MRSTLREIVFQRLGEIAEGLHGGGRDFLVLVPERRGLRDLLAQHVVDEVEVAVVFVGGGVDEDRIGVGEDLAGLVERARDLRDAGEHMAEADFFGRVLLGHGQEHGVADELNVDGRLVLVALDLFELEQAVGDLVVDESPVGLVFQAEGVARDFASESRAPVAVKGGLAGEGLRAEVVEFGVELDGVAGFGIAVLVVAGLGGVDRGERERFVHELLGEAGELRVVGVCGCGSLLGHGGDGDQK
jgi:hypothetical protein